MSTSKLRQAARGLALAAETCSLLISDALGALVERLEDTPEIGSMTIPVVPEIQKPVTVEDLEAMRGGFSRNTFTFRAEAWHSDGCTPYGCVPGCVVMREKADRLAHAGYGNAFADNDIRDDEQTREADPVARAHATISRIVDELLPSWVCGAMQPEEHCTPDQHAPYQCSLSTAHTEHVAVLAGEVLARWPVER